MNKTRPVLKTLSVFKILVHHWCRHCSYCTQDLVLFSGFYCNWLNVVTIRYRYRKSVQVNPHSTKMNIMGFIIYYLLLLFTIIEHTLKAPKDFLLFSLFFFFFFFWRAYSTYGPMTFTLLNGLFSFSLSSSWINLLLIFQHWRWYVCSASRAGWRRLL